MDTIKRDPTTSGPFNPFAQLTLFVCTAIALGLCLILGGCLDLSPARGGLRPDPDGGAGATALLVQQGSMGLPGAPPRDGLGPASPLWLELSAPLDPATISGDTVVLVAGTRQEVGDAFFSDLDHPPLSDIHHGRRVSARVTLLEHRLEIHPLRPLEPSRDHVVALSAALRSLDGQKLTRPDGTPGGVTIDFRTGPAGSGPPWLALVAPPAQQTEVPINLARVVVVASEPVTRLPFGLRLRADDGEEIDGRAEATGGCPTGVGGTSPSDPHGTAADPQAAFDRSGGRCFALVLGAPLRPGRWYTPVTLPGVTDHDGEPLVEPPASEAFRTGEHADLQPPKVQVSRVIARDHDLVILADSDELATLAATAIPELETPNESREAARHAEAGPARQFQLVLPNLVADRVHRLEISVVDGAGNVSGTQLVTRTLPELPAVAITEVLADPLSSPEPAGEFVELHNFGPVPVDLTGWTLTDNPEGTGASTLAGVLPPGGFALLVSEHYAGPLATTAVVIPVGGDVAQRGLSNAGETLVLADAAGQTVSTFGSPATPRAGVSLERVPPDAPDVPSSWRAGAPGGATPGGPAAGW